MKRLFFILHQLGTVETYAESAGEAERKALVPGGFKRALAVVDAGIISTARGTLAVRALRPIDPRMPFVAIVGGSLSGGIAQ